MEIVINISDEDYKQLKGGHIPFNVLNVLQNGTPLTPKILADLLMEERIRGELKQDVSYSKDVIDDVRCRLTVDIIDRRPCYCGAELGAVWRERKESKE
jgi:hypothetical protein